MSFLLDTDTCSCYLRERGRITTRFQQHSGQLNVSVITIAELCAWIYKTSTPRRHHSGLAELLITVHALPVDEETARLAGKLRAMLIDSGQTASTTDMLIAATALIHDCTVVSHNTKHFAPVPGLRVVDWLAE